MGDQLMYSVLLAIDSEDLVNQIRKLHIWGDATEFEVTAIEKNTEDALLSMKQNHYDLVLAMAKGCDVDGVHILRTGKKQKMCSHIALCGNERDFDSARIGIILGAFDYMVAPFDENLFIAMFSRIKNESLEAQASAFYYAENIMEYFKSGNQEIYNYVTYIFDEITKRDTDLVRVNEKLVQICNSVSDGIEKENPWAKQFIVKRSYDDLFDGGIGSVNENKSRFERAINQMFEEYCELCPYVSNDRIREVIIYMLRNPERDLKQKTIASEFYMNSSYLSTVFLSQTGVRFVDYLNTVKLKRAAWLLKETDMKIIEVAARLDYKDMGYFCKLFKARYNLTPSDFRLPDDYDYQI
jgi:two-component system response regulator YesN